MLYHHPQTPTTPALTESAVRTLHPHTSFPSPLLPADVVALGYQLVQPTPQPAHDDCTHTCTELPPTLIDEPVTSADAPTLRQAWKITPRPEAEAAQRLAARTTAQAATARAERDRLLAACDWTQLPDAQANHSQALRAAWLAYRQSLRSVPEQTGFPSDIAWPASPSSNSIPTGN